MTSTTSTGDPGELGASGARAEAEALRQRLGMEHLRVLAPDMVNLLGRGVLADVEVRLPPGSFKLAIPREDLGIRAGARNESDREEELRALSEHLRATQRSDLLPRDLMKRLGSWTDAEGKTRRGIADPEHARRALYLLFPSTKKTADEPRARDITPRTTTPDNNAARYEILAIPTYQGAFLTEAAWPRWYAKYERARDHFYGVRDQLLEHYDALLQQSLLDFRIIAGRTFQIILDATGEPPADPAGEPYRLQRWLDDWHQRVRAAWPTREQIRAGFVVLPTFSYPPRPSAVAQDLARAESIRVESLRERIEVDTAQQIAREVRETEVRRAHNLIDQFLSTFVRRVEDACLPFLASTAKNRRVSGKQLQLLRNVTEMVKTLGQGVGGLDGLRAQMAQVESLLAARDTLHITGSVSEYRLDLDENAKRLATALRETARVVRDEALALGAMDARETDPARYGDPDTLLTEILGYRQPKASQAQRAIGRGESSADTGVDASRTGSAVDETLVASVLDALDRPAGTAGPVVSAGRL